MNEKSNKATITKILLASAAFVILVAGIREAKAIVVPFLLAAFIAIVVSHLLQLLQNQGLPTWLALVVVIVGVVVLSGGVAGLVGRSANDFVDDLPEHQTNLRQQTKPLAEWLTNKGWEMPPELAKVLGLDTEQDDSTPENDEDDNMMGITLRDGFQYVGILARELGGVFGNAMVIILTLVFMLLEASRFPAKLDSILSDTHFARGHVDEIVINIRRYMAIKTATSAVTGILAAIALKLLGVDYAALWGLIAFLFNFVPSIGSIIAAIPAVLLALVQFGVGQAAGVAIVYIVINVLIGNVIEPRIMGQGLGLSTLIVFLSLVFWGWVLGPVGMLLSAPLTMIVKIILADYEDTRWIAVLMGAKAETAS